MIHPERMNDPEQTRRDTRFLEGAYADQGEHFRLVLAVTEFIDMLAEEISTIPGRRDAVVHDDTYAKDMHATLMLIHHSAVRAVDSVRDESPHELSDTLSAISDYLTTKTQQALKNVFGTCNECASLTAPAHDVVQRHATALTEDETVSIHAEQFVSHLDSHASSIAKHVFEHIAREL